jgi:hypothetical protein
VQKYSGQPFQGARWKHDHPLFPVQRHPKAIAQLLLKLLLYVEICLLTKLLRMVRLLLGDRKYCDADQVIYASICTSFEKLSTIQKKTLFSTMKI